MNIRQRIIRAAVCAAALGAGTAQAASIYWSGGAGDGIWTNAANWTGGVLPTSSDLAYIDNGDTVSFADGMTNQVSRSITTGGSVLNVTGGWLNGTTSGNSVRDIVGSGESEGVYSYLNVSGGLYQSSHILRVGIGGNGIVNLNGGSLQITRGGTSSFGNSSTSLSIGNDSGDGAVNVTNGTLQTRVAVEVGPNGTFDVYGAASTISIGGHGGSADGSWYQSSNGVLRIGISTDGLTPIVVNDDSGVSGTPTVKLDWGAVLDVSFVDGAMETNSWPVIVCTNGTINNLGMVLAEGIDTNDWGFITSNNTLYVGYGLGWPQGNDIVSIPDAGRTLYWTGAGNDTASDNPTNWVLDTTALIQATWGPYDGDYWKIAHSTVTGVEPGTDYVVDYDGTAVNSGHQDLDVGDGAQGTFNMNSGELTFTATSSSRQEFGVNSGGDGTLNMNDGTLTLNATRVGVSGADGRINLNGGTLTISRAYGDYSLWVGHSGISTGTVTVTGGRIFTRTGVKLGDGANAYGIFGVEGSAATSIGIGSQNTLDGEWLQYAGSVLKVRVDAGGITPISIVEVDEEAGGNDGNVYFYEGAVLDVDWMSGATNYNSFDVMTWDGELVESNLTFASSVDTNIWSFAFVDDNSDGTNDTLRVTAYGETAKGTPYSWLMEYGLSISDDETDTDGDGHANWEEYLTGTNPTNAASVFQVTSAESIGDGSFVITWSSVEDKTYMIQSNTSLTVQSPGTVAVGIEGQPNETSYTGTISGADTVFYEVGLE